MIDEQALLARQALNRQRVRTKQRFINLSEERYRIWMIDPLGGTGNGYSDNVPGSQINRAGRRFLRCYEYDLRYPAPRYLDFSTWDKRGIFILRPKEELDPYLLLRAVSTHRERHVFILWGRSLWPLEAALEPDRGHLLIMADYPRTPWGQEYYIKHKPFTTTCEYLNIPKDIWRLR